MKILSELKVADVYDPDVASVMQVHTGDDFAEVIQSFASRSDARAIFVIDDGGQIVGIISRSDILEWSRAKLGAYFSVRDAQTERTLRIASLIHATSVGDVIHSSSVRASVQLEDLLQSALRLMLELELIALAVVDEEGRIAGQLSLSHILSAALTDATAE